MNIHDSATSFQPKSTTSAAILSNIIIHHNLFWECGVAHEYRNNTLGGITDNYRFENNTIYKSGYGLGSTNTNYYSSMWLQWGFFPDVHQTNGPSAVPTNMSIRNNISYLTRVDRPDVDIYDSWYNNNAVNGITVENNIFTRADPHWPNNIVQNPLFVDPDNNDFHLQSGSAAVGAGVCLGYEKDFDGNNIEPPCNIGAYD